MVQSTTAWFFSRAAAKTKNWVSVHSNVIMKRLEDIGMSEKKELYVGLIEGVQRRQVRKFSPQLTVHAECGTDPGDSAPPLQELLLSYNIGIPVDIREKEMNKRAAKLVGLELPPVSKE